MASCVEAQVIVDDTSAPAGSPDMPCGGTPAPETLPADTGASSTEKEVVSEAINVPTEDTKSSSVENEATENINVDHESPSAENDVLPKDTEVPPTQNEKQAKDADAPATENEVPSEPQKVTSTENDAPSVGSDASSTENPTLSAETKAPSVVNEVPEPDVDVSKQAKGTMPDVETEENVSDLCSEGTQELKEKQKCSID